MIINTSFNVRGEPIVCTPEDAYRCFMATDMDVLVLENFVLLKDEQPEPLAVPERRLSGAIRPGRRPAASTNRHVVVRRGRENSRHQQNCPRGEDTQSHGRSSNRAQTYRIQNWPAGRLR